MSEDEYKRIFSKNFKDLLALRGKTQSDVMRDLGLSCSTVSNWATGTKMPRMHSVQMLANYLMVNKSDLLEDKKALETIAAHKDDDWTADELRQIERFKAYLRSLRNIE